MIKNLIIKNIAFGFAIIILISCESHDQRPDNAFESFKQNKILTKDCVLVSQITPQVPDKIEIGHKKEIKNEWEIFETEISKKILSNENKIKEMRDIPDANAKLIKKIASLEKKNNGMRRVIIDYPEEVRVKREEFKTNTREELKAIDVKLKELAVNRKK